MLCAPNYHIHIFDSTASAFLNVLPKSRAVVEIWPFSQHDGDVVEIVVSGAYVGGKQIRHGLTDNILKNRCHTAGVTWNAPVHMSPST